jgi:hypothetical protein
MTDSNQNPISFAQIGILARLLAQENITVQHKHSAHTASFDVEKRILTLPIWEGITKDVYDMLVIHEVGHALDTPSDGWIEEIKRITKKFYKNGHEDIYKLQAVKSFMNVIEDVRIDKRQKRRFPGCRKNYVNAYKELMTRDFFGLNGANINSLSFIDRVNLHSKGGAMLGIKFTAEESALLNEIMNTETFDEVMALTEKVFAWSRKKDKVFKKTIREMNAADNFMKALKEDIGKNIVIDGEGNLVIQGNDEEEDEIVDLSDPTVDEVSDSFLEDEPETEEEAQPEKKEEKDDPMGHHIADEPEWEFGDEKEKPKEEEASDFKKDEPDSDEWNPVPVAKTQENWDKMSQSLIASDSHQYIYVDMPEPIYENIVDDYKVVIPQWKKSVEERTGEQWRATSLKQLNAFKQEENAAISFLLKEFDMRKSAEIYQKTAVAKTGVIDTNKLHAYKYSDDIFRRLNVVPKGTNHGFFMIMDWSYSMSGNLTHTIRQLMTLTLFCKRAQLPFEVYIFRNLSRKEQAENGKNPKKFWKLTDKCIQPHDFKLRNLLSSRMTNAEFNQALFNLWTYYNQSSDPLGSTPLDEAVAVLPKMINDFQKRNGLEVVNTIILTDGGADGMGYTEGVEQEKNPQANKITYVVHENKTKSDIYVDRMINTKNLLNILRSQTNCNIIGFYLYEYGWKAIENQWFWKSQGTPEMVKLQKQWDEDKYVGITEAGYDEYFIINTKKMKDTRNVLEINDSMTKRTIAKNFAKFSKVKIVNRVMLRNFVERIAHKKKMG